MRDKEGTFDSLRVVYDHNIAEAQERFRRPSGQIGFDCFYMGTLPVWSTGTGAPSLNQIRCLPFFSGRGGVVDRIAFDCTVVGGAGSQLRLGIYDADQGSLYPTTLLADSGTIDGTLATGVRAFPVNATLQPSRLYWLCGLHGTTAATVRITGGAPLPIFGFGGSTWANNGVGCGWIINFAFGPLPNPAPAGGTPIFISSGAMLVGISFSQVF